MRKTSYTCDFCYGIVVPDFGGESPNYNEAGAQMVGIHSYGSGKIALVPPDDVKAGRHVCAQCWSALHQLPKMCGQGFWNCNGGPNCGGDHK